MQEISLYTHLPFCKKKCNYCDFVSYAGKEALIDEYAEALIRELEQLHSTNNYLLSTIYFGGGTPTLLEPKHFEKILGILVTRYALPITKTEITIEANPGTANKSKLKALRKLGINRLSIGAQSFNDKHLKTLGRIHDSKDIFRFYEDARSAGFENINLDVIFALPNQSLDEWEEDLKTAISLNPAHLSTYNLELHENTPLYSHYALHITDKEETELAMYEHTIETLTASGYHHYEISNFALPGLECQHNIVYWKSGNYLGIGTGAHSHINGKRWANSNSVETYMRQALGKGKNKVRDTLGDTIFMGLRMLEGLPIDQFRGFEKEVTELIENGLLIRKNNHYKLTRKGIYLANEVFVRFV